MYKILTIAGSDSSGGAGVQADIKTITAHGMFAMTAHTALTAQNTTGVYDILNVPPEFLAKEIDVVFEDIRPDSVKIGMVPGAEFMEVIADKLIYHKAKNVVIDPVMVAESGSKLMPDDAVNILKTKLLPLATVITPNLKEAEVLINRSINTKDDMITAAKEISKEIGTAVLLKGGHSIDNADDLLIEDKEITWLTGKRINNPNAHGTGCTLSSAIACNLAKGLSLKESVKNAKNYVTGALKDGMNLGKGSGPLNHMYQMK